MYVREGQGTQKKAYNIKLDVVLRGKIYNLQFFCFGETVGLKRLDQLRDGFRSLGRGRLILRGEVLDCLQKALKRVRVSRA